MILHGVGTRPRQLIVGHAANGREKRSRVHLSERTM